MGTARCRGGTLLKHSAGQCSDVVVFWCRCRKIGEAGSQQLLLDTQAIKALLLELPSAGKPRPFLSPTRRHILGSSQGSIAAPVLLGILSMALERRTCGDLNLVGQTRLEHS